MADYNITHHNHPVHYFCGPNCPVWGELTRVRNISETSFRKMDKALWDIQTFTEDVELKLDVRGDPAPPAFLDLFHLSVVRFNFYENTTVLTHCGRAWRPDAGDLNSPLCRTCAARVETLDI